MARPKKPESEKASKTLGPIRITDKQDEDYRRTAKNNGYSLSAWVKKVLGEAVEKD